MSANNRRIRRIIVELLFEYGAMTKEGMADLLAKNKSIRTVPSPHSLSALMSKNPQIIPVGAEDVENAVGIKASHLVYDIDRVLIKTKEDIVYSRTPTVMTPAQTSKSQRCSLCGRIRVFPDGEEKCIHCIRDACE
tara:strand:+ start:474 stop:881 length:408 start_codon:yes stop_codon:yes gene_type:complete